MKIRPATPADIEAIIAVGRQTWPATSAFAGPEYIGHGLATWWSAEAVTRSLATTEVLVAAEDDTIVGTGNIDLRGEVAIIWKLYVLPGTQGSGAGSALVKALTARAGDRPVRLEYTDGNDKAARFYASQGFTEVKREPGDRPDWPDTVWLEQRHRVAI